LRIRSKVWTQKSPKRLQLRAFFKWWPDPESNWGFYPND
jgi:hypothetical protein